MAQAKHPFQVAYESVDAQKIAILEKFTASFVVNRRMLTPKEVDSETVYDIAVSDDGLIEELVQESIKTGFPAKNKDELIRGDCYERMALWFFLAATDQTGDFVVQVPFKSLFEEFLSNLGDKKKKEFNAFFDGELPALLDPKVYGDINQFYQENANLTHTELKEKKAKERYLSDADREQLKIKADLADEALSPEDRKAADDANRALTFGVLSLAFANYADTLASTDGDTVSLSAKAGKLLQIKNRLKNSELPIGVYIQALDASYFSALEDLANPQIPKLRQSKIEELETQSGISRSSFNPRMWKAAALTEDELISNKLAVIHYATPSFWQKPGGRALKIIIGAVIGAAAGFVLALAIGGLAGGLLETHYLSKLTTNLAVIHAWPGANEFFKAVFTTFPPNNWATGGLWIAAGVALIVGAIAGAVIAHKHVGEEYDPLKGVEPLPGAGTGNDYLPEGCTA